jgi:hypothetical protein
MRNDNNQSAVKITIHARKNGRRLNIIIAQSASTTHSLRAA